MSIKRSAIKQRADTVGMVILLGLLTGVFLGMAAGCAVVVYQWVSQ